MEDFQKIRYLFFKRRVNKQKKYEKVVKQYEDELFDLYYKNYERLRLKEYGEGNINKSENEMLEIDAYYAWCDEIVDMQPQLKKADNRYKLVRCGAVPILTGATLAVATKFGSAPITVAIAGAAMIGAGVVQAIRARHAKKHYFLNPPSRGRYYFTHIYNNKPVDLRLGYRKQVSERFAKEHHIDYSSQQKTL